MFWKITSDHHTSCCQLEYTDIAVVCGTSTIDLAVQICPVIYTGYNGSLLILNRIRDNPNCHGTLDTSVAPPVVRFSFPIREGDACGSNFMVCMAATRERGGRGGGGGGFVLSTLALIVHLLNNSADHQRPRDGNILRLLQHPVCQHQRGDPLPRPHHRHHHLQRGAQVLLLVRLPSGVSRQQHPGWRVSVDIITWLLPLAVRQRCSLPPQVVLFHRSDGQERQLHQHPEHGSLPGTGLLTCMSLLRGVISV